MTAAEKRAEFAKCMGSLLNLASGKRNPFESPMCDFMADFLTFTDDPAPSPQLDWRDEVVSWGTGWARERIEVIRAVPMNSSTIIYRVFGDGRVRIAGQEIAPSNNDSLSRCRLIDQFIAGLEGKA